jgi:hypothetical protein
MLCLKKAECNRVARKSSQKAVLIIMHEESVALLLTQVVCAGVHGSATKKGTYKLLQIRTVQRTLFCKLLLHSQKCFYTKKVQQMFASGSILQPLRVLFFPRAAIVHQVRPLVRRKYVVVVVVVVHPNETMTADDDCMNDFLVDTERQL